MSNFDIRTAFSIVGLLYLLLPSITWLALVRQRSLSIDLWCGGGLLVGVATLMISRYGLAPGWITLQLSSLLLLASHFFRIQSLRIDLGMPWPLGRMVLAVGVLFLVFMWLDVGLQQPIWRAQYNSTLGAGLLLYLAMLAWRIGREEQSPNARWIAITYGLVSVAFVIRVLTLGEQHSTTVVTHGIGSQMIALTTLLGSVIGHFGYVGLALDRAMRREVKAATSQARDEERHHLGHQIAQLDRQRSLGELSASLGHELNQPLTAILTNTQVAKRGLQAGRFDSAQVVEFLDKIVHNTQRASQIIERIRNFIRPSDARSEAVNVNHVVREVLALVADEAHSRKVAIAVTAPAQPLMVSGDPIALSQIVLNAVRNAMEALATAPVRKIMVYCSSADARVSLRITDTGPGFTTDALAQAGAPFFTTKATGLGLGLAISRSIAQHYGGTLTLSNAFDGAGAVVELTLPALDQTQP
ncbi:MAG: GHKL domain-containing protein [Comamonadaceae bacterium]|nr:GHKL domain-containing protein [Comamonadaceae bacterium]